MSFSKPNHRLSFTRAERIPAPPSGAGFPVPAVKELDLARLRREQRLDEELAQSFPASDPPSWVHGTTPAPR